MRSDGWINRRGFLAAQGLAVLGAWAPKASAAPSATALDIIDCHTHFYDPARPQGVPWPAKNTPLYRTVLPKHLKEQPQFRPVTGTVIVEASPWVEDNQWLLDIAKNDPFITGIVGNLNPGSADFSKDLRRFAANPLFRGIRVSADVLRTALEAGRLEGFHLMADLDLALDINGKDSATLAARLATNVPGLRIVLNHLGSVAVTAEAPPKGWAEGLGTAANHQNIWIKISALAESAAQNGKTAPLDLPFYRPYIDVIWNAFGDERVIYGSNWPVSERACDYLTMQRIALEYAFEKGDAATRKFCSLNAKRAYKWLDRPERLQGGNPPASP
jgi:L-fuconolactonase